MSQREKGYLMTRVSELTLRVTWFRMRWEQTGNVRHIIISCVLQRIPTTSQMRESVLEINISDIRIFIEIYALNTSSRKSHFTKFFSPFSLFSSSSLSLFLSLSLSQNNFKYSHSIKYYKDIYNDFKTIWNVM